MSSHDLAFLECLYASFKDYPTFRWREFRWRGLNFQNRLGIAGGVDKNGEMMEAWQKLGAGFVEVGTVTLFLRNQFRRILERDWEHKNLGIKWVFPVMAAKIKFTTIC